MKKSFAMLALSILVSGPGSAQNSVEVGQPAPDFEMQDSAGKTFRLSDYRGKKAVVLEFFRSGDW